MVIVIGAARLAGGDCSEPSTKAHTLPQTQPTAKAESTVAAMLTFLSFRLWMSAPTQPSTTEGLAR